MEHIYFYAVTADLPITIPALQKKTLLSGNARLSNSAAMSLLQNVMSIQDQIQSNLVSITRIVSQISSEDLGFQRSLNSTVGDLLEEGSDRILHLSSQLLRSASSIPDTRSPVLEDSDDVENEWRGIVDVIDALLEKADSCLDEYSGVVKRSESSNPEVVC